MDKTLFDSLAEKTGLQDRARRLAYRVLVEGEKSVEVAKDEDVTRQLVDQAARRITRQQEIENGIPESWLPVSVSLPPELANAVKWIYRQARLDAGLVVDTDRKPPDISAEAVELITDLIAGRARRK